LWFPVVVLAIVTVILVVQVRVLAIAVSHAGRVDSVAEQWYRMACGFSRT
jgi:hypothetical protein